MLHDVTIARRRYPAALSALREIAHQCEPTLDVQKRSEQSLLLFENGVPSQPSSCAAAAGSVKDGTACGSAASKASGSSVLREPMSRGGETEEHLP